MFLIALLTGKRNFFSFFFENFIIRHALVIHCPSFLASSQLVVIAALFTWLLHPGDSELKGLCGLWVKLPPVYLIRWRLHTVSYIAGRQAGKPWILIFIVFFQANLLILPKSRETCKFRSHLIRGNCHLFFLSCPTIFLGLD